MIFLEDVRSATCTRELQHKLLDVQDGENNERLVAKSGDTRCHNMFKKKGDNNRRSKRKDPRTNQERCCYCTV